MIGEKKKHVKHAHVLRTHYIVLKIALILLIFFPEVIIKLVALW